MRRVYTTERYDFDGTLPGYNHGDPIRIVVHRQGNPGARALSSLAWGDRTDTYTIHSYVDRDGMAIDALSPTIHAYHVREHRKAALLGYPTRQLGRRWLRRRGDIRALGIETVDLGTKESYHLSQETRITLLLRIHAYMVQFPGIKPKDVHEHAELDPWTRKDDLGNALNMTDFRLDLGDLIAGRDPWRTVREFATGARAPASWQTTPTAPNNYEALEAIRKAQANLTKVRELIGG